MSGPTIIEAHAFNLKDKDGNTVGCFGTSKEGEPCLSLAGKDGKARIVLLFSAEGEARFGFFDSEGNNRVNVSLLDDGVSSVMLKGGPGKPTCGLMGDDAGGHHFVTLGVAGKPRHVIGITEDGHPQLLVYNPDGEVVYNPIQPTGEGKTEGGIILPTPPKLRPELRE